MYRIIGADQKEYGPIPADQVRQWIADRRLNANSLAMPDGGSEWKALSTFPEFAAAISIAAPVFPALQQTPGTNSMAVAGLTCGVLCWLGACCCSGVPFNVLGIVFSSVALSQLAKNPNQRGRNMAIAGLALSITQLVFAIALIIAGNAFNWPDILKDLRKL